MAEPAERIELLRRVRLFSNLNQDELEAIDSILEEKRFKKGSAIFSQGDEGDALYIVESGRIKAAIKDDQGREKVLGVFSEGDYFGEMALLSDQPRTATMTVVGDAEVFMLPKTAFEQLLSSNLEVMRQFVSLMSRRLAEANSLVRTDDARPERVLGKSLVVFSPKGGSGKTTLAVNLAVTLRELTNKSVVVVDCSYPFGDVGIMLNMDPKRTIVDLLPHVNELSGEIIESILQNHPSGVKVLMAPPTPEETELVTAEHINIIVSALRELYEFIIIDTHSSFTDVSIGALDTADLILLVTTMEVPALKNVRQFIDTATQKLGYPVEKIAILVNRAGPIGGLSIADVESSVGAKVVATISSNGSVAVTAANQGVPFAISSKDSQIYRDMVSLAKMITPQAVSEEDELGEAAGGAEALTPVQRLRQAPMKLRRSFVEGVSNIGLPDFLLGLGSLFAVSAPFILIFAMLGLVGKALGAASGFPAGPAFNLSIWAGIVGGVFLLSRVRPQRRGSWVFGAMLGACYGFIFTFASVAISNVVGGELRTPVPVLILNLLPYAVLGIIGSILAERTRPQTQALLAS